MSLLKPRAKSTENPAALNALKRVKGEEKDKRFNFAVPANIHAKVKATCAYRGVSMQEFVLSALTREIERGESSD